MKILVISCSLKSESRSRLLAEAALEAARKNGAEVELIDLRNHPLPLCDGEKAYAHPDIKIIRSKIEKARGLLVSTPIYNYDASAATKNLVELTGSSWEDKTVGFLCAAGGHSSFMSIMALAGSLMLDFRCVIVPRFVYATGRDFSEDGLTGDEVKRRIALVVKELTALAAARRPGDDEIED